MERCSRTPLHSPHERRAGKVLTALACAVALAGCGDDVTKNYYTEPGPTSTTGALNININPPSATVVVTGPGYSQSATGNHLYTGLAAGQYKASATAPGFVAATNNINVVAGFTSSISMILQQIPTPVEVPRAAYRDEKGVLVPLDGSLLQSGQFVFYAWLQDAPLVGIDPASLTDAIDADPGMPFLIEQRETAPSFTQNLGAAFVGFKDAKGIVRPVIGADVRWEIDQWWDLSVNSMQFGTSDDNRVGLGYGVFDDQADTRTNNSRLETERFPLIAGAYPFYNQSGVGSPYTDGFTWVTLFSPDAKASARIVLVAVVDGAEVGKQILYKNFAPAPRIEITKTVDKDVLNLDLVGGNVATWTVTVKNVGEGDATNVVLNDFLKSGGLANYTLAGYPAGTSDGAGGFDYTFDLPSSNAPPPPQNSQLLGNAWNFAILANATVTNTGSSVINGNVGVSAGTAVTGFPPGIVLNGSIHNNDAMATAAQTSVTAARAALAARTCPGDDNTPPLTGTITPGVYCYSSAAALSGPVILDAKGDPSAEFVFKIGETLMTPVDSDVPVTLANGASACNVYWLVGSSATLNSTSPFVGNIIASASITTGAGANITGRALAGVGAVTLSGASTINAPLNCVAAAGNSQTFTLTATVDAPGTYCNQAEITSFDSATSTTTPVDLNGEACFTAVESQVSIVKDFVAADGTTSLGKAQTVAKNVPAYLRVRVINSGGGNAAGVNVTDVLDGGASLTYAITTAPAATVPNAVDGFTTLPDNAFDLPAPTPPATATTKTYLFTVKSTDDGVFCDIGTVTATSGTLGNSSDRACLTVATPKLEITKVDGPKPSDPTKYLSVIPGGSYTSTIVVKNVGAATAKGVIIRDLLGYDTVHKVQAIYVSSSLNGVSGTLASNLVSANPVDILPGQSMTFTVVSRIPLGAVAGTYCDTASVTSSNAAPIGSVDDCVSVPPYAAIQTQLVDLADPIAQGSTVTYSTTLYVEALSNVGVAQNELKYSFGHTGSFTVETAGVVTYATGFFRIVSTAVYLDSNPVRDPTTGFVTSDSGSPTAVRLTLDTEYTIDPAGHTDGQQTIELTPSITLLPNTALFVVQVVTVPGGTPGTPAGLYNTSYEWTSVPAYTTPTPPTYVTTKSEPTTVLP